jgi:hypothetical protein
LPRERSPGQRPGAAPAGSGAGGSPAGGCAPPAGGVRRDERLYSGDLFIGGAIPNRRRNDNITVARLPRQCIIG